MILHSDAALYYIIHNFVISACSQHDVHINFHTYLSDGRLPELESVYFPYVEGHTAFNFLSTFFRLRIVPGYVFDEALVPLVVVIACFTFPRAVSVSVALRKTFPPNKRMVREVPATSR